MISKVNQCVTANSLSPISSLYLHLEPWYTWVMIFSKNRIFGTKKASSTRGTAWNDSECRNLSFSKVCWTQESIKNGDRFCGISTFSNVVSWQFACQKQFSANFMLSKASKRHSVISKVSQLVKTRRLVGCAFLQLNLSKSYGGGSLSYLFGPSKNGQTLRGRNFWPDWAFSILKPDLEIRIYGLIFQPNLHFLVVTPLLSKVRILSGTPS